MHSVCARRESLPTSSSAFRSVFCLLVAFAYRVPQVLSRSKVSEVQHFIDKEIEQLALILFYIQQSIGLDPPKSASTNSETNLAQVLALARKLSVLRLMLLLMVNEYCR